MSLDLDRSAWRRVKFGDVVRQCKESTDPEIDGVERYVAGEHMETDNLRISSWGEVGDGYLGPAFHRKFKAGQVLYGSRRTYLRKVARADFDGVCANTTFVMESADQGILLPDLLPFLMSTESFHAHSISESKGSVNPYVNWPDIAKFEFDLPPLDQQRRIADLLWSIEHHSSALKAVAQSATDAYEARLRESVVDLSSHGQPVPLKDLCEPERPITYGIVQAGPHVEGGVPYIRVSDMTDGHLSREGMLRTSQAIADKYARSTVLSGDLVVALRGPTGLTMTVPEELDGANLTQGTARLAIMSGPMVAEFVQVIMNSRWMQTQIARSAKGSTFKELSLAALRSLQIPMPELEEMERFLVDLDYVNAARIRLRQEGEAVHAMHSQLMHEVFS